jgi:hypothetical protein
VSASKPNKPVSKIVHLVKVERNHAGPPAPQARGEPVALSCDPYNSMGRACAELIYKRLR